MSWEGNKELEIKGLWPFLLNSTWKDLGVPLWGHQTSLAHPLHHTLQISFSDGMKNEEVVVGWTSLLLWSKKRQYVQLSPGHFFCFISLSYDSMTRNLNIRFHFSDEMKNEVVLWWTSLLLWSKKDNTIEA